MCTILILSGAMGVMDMLKQSRLLAVLCLLFSIYDLVRAIIHAQSAWIIVLWSVLFVFQLASSIADFMAIAKTIPLLLVPIVWVTVQFCIINSALLIMAIVPLVDPNSFLAAYLRANYASKGLTDEEVTSKVRTLCISTLATSIGFLIVEIRAIFVHMSAYKTIIQRQNEAKNDLPPAYY